MQHETGVRPIEMSVGSSRGLVLGMDDVKSGDEEASDVNPEDGDETEGDKVMDSDTDGPESAEQEFSAEDAPEEIKLREYQIQQIQRRRNANGTMLRMCRTDPGAAYAWKPTGRKIHITDK